MRATMLDIRAAPHLTPSETAQTCLIKSGGIIPNLGESLVSILVSTAGKATAVVVKAPAQTADDHNPNKSDHLVAFTTGALRAQAMMVIALEEYIAAKKAVSGISGSCGTARSSAHPSPAIMDHRQLPYWLDCHSIFAFAADHRYGKLRCTGVFCISDQIGAPHSNRFFIFRMGAPLVGHIEKPSLRLIVLGRSYNDRCDDAVLSVPLLNAFVGQHFLTNLFCVGRSGGCASLQI